MSGSNIREAIVKVAQWGINGRLDGRSRRAAITAPSSLER
jgi:dolichol-phosphate mannosyltransferase